jgi:putative ABC transport system ATP-binding protein
VIFLENTNTIQLNKVCKTYGASTNKTAALKEATIKFCCGEFTAITGKSGSGKSTLLNMVSGIDRPSSGEVIHGKNLLHSMDENDLAKWRGRNVGMVFQFFQLIPTLTVLANLLLPMDFCGIIPARQRRQKANYLLKRMDVSQYANRLPHFLSGGEQQRVAIARSLVNDPAFIFADEPTGNLDTKNAGSITKLLCEMAADGKAIIMVTHSKEIANIADRVVSINDGIIVGDIRHKAVQQ